MGKSKKKIPGLMMKGRKRPQEEVKQYNGLSAKELKRLRNTALQHYEEYIDSAIWKRKQIISQILTECGLDNNFSNRQKVSSIISNEKRKRESEKEKTLTSVLMSIEGPKHRNRLPRSVSEEINSFIIKNNLHIKYLKAGNDFFEKANITKDILKEFNIYDCDENRRMIQRLISKTTFKPWSNEEEKVLEKLLSEKVNTAVWNESGDNKKIIQVRKQIMVKFKEQFPDSEHNDNDITHKIASLVCRIKNIIPKPKDIVQQAASQVIEKQVQINNVSNMIERSISDNSSSQSRGPEATNNVDKATLDAIRQISNIIELVNGFSK